MEEFPTLTLVVALALIDDCGRILLQQRPERKHHGGLWEFPGGKVEQGETPREALCREIAEELGLELEPEALTQSAWAEENSDCPIVLLLYTSQQRVGEVVPHDEQQWGWFTREEAANLPLAPMDRQLLAQLRL